MDRRPLLKAGGPSVRTGGPCLEIEGPSGRIIKGSYVVVECFFTRMRLLQIGGPSVNMVDIEGPYGKIGGPSLWIGDPSKEIGGPSVEIEAALYKSEAPL